MMRTAAALLGVLASLAIGCVGTAATEVPDNDEPEEMVGTTVEEVKDATACEIALGEETLACATAAVQGGVDVPNDAACLLATANAAHACQP